MDMEDTLVDCTLTRGPIRGKNRDRIGLIFKVRTRRDIEDFMKNLANERRMPVDAVADTWQNCSSSDAPSLEFYATEAKFSPSRVYTLDQIAGPLIINNDREGGLRVRDDSDMINLSFLRLAGISDESGVTIGLIGPYSNDYIKRVKTGLPKAITQFLQDYIVPVTLNLKVISKS